MNSSKFIVFAIVASLISACAPQNGGAGGGVMQGGSVNKQDIGTVAGAIGGGVLGSTIGSGKGRTAATIGGALLGGMIGNSIGASLDQADVPVYNSTTQRALETAPAGKTLPWSNPQTGNSGTVIPSAPYQNPNGQYCREYNQTIVVGGKKQSGHGTACREPDGSWKIVE
jgi:surface antigen